MFQVFLAPISQKFLKKCEKEVYERVMKQVNGLASEPFPQGVVRVFGRQEKIFRIRVGMYRIQYVVYHEKNEILITDIDKRPRAYD